MVNSFVASRSGIRLSWSRRLTGSLLCLLLLAGIVALPAQAMHPPSSESATEGGSADGLSSDVECPVEMEQDPQEAAAADEAQALGLAAACGIPVEVSSARGFSERTWAQPEGHLRSEISAVPQWVRDESGAWVDVDTSLRWDADGSVRSTATVSSIRISGGGDGPFVTATGPDAGELALTWPDALPTPTLDGDTATFADVLPDVPIKARTRDEDRSLFAQLSSATAHVTHPWQLADADGRRAAATGAQGRRRLPGFDVGSQGVDELAPVLHR